MHSDDFRIGGVLRESAAVLRGNFRAFAAVSFLLVGLPVLAVEGLFLESLSFRESMQAGGEYAGTSLFATGGFSARSAALIERLASFVVGLLAMWLYGSITAGVARVFDGQPVTVRRLLSAGADGMGTVFRLYILVLVAAFTVGILFTVMTAQLGGGFLDNGYHVIVPLATAGVVLGAVALAARWAMVVPVAMLENRGVIEALGRSAHLSAGLRWRIVGLILLLTLVFILGYGLVLALVWMVPVPMSISASVGDMILQAGGVTISAVAFCVVYNRVRQIKEGEAPAVVAKVFD